MYKRQLRTNPKARPKSFWINTSENSIVRYFISSANKQTQREIERLIEGESVSKEIDQELTYKDLYSSAENIWSILFTTGYLTQKEESGDEIFQLVIPNMEIRDIYIRQVREWFRAVSYTHLDGYKRQLLCVFFRNGRDMDGI